MKKTLLVGALSIGLLSTSAFAQVNEQRYDRDYDRAQTNGQSVREVHDRADRAYDRTDHREYKNHDKKHKKHMKHKRGHDCECHGHKGVYHGDAYKKDGYGKDHHRNMRQDDNGYYGPGYYKDSKGHYKYKDMGKRYNDHVSNEPRGWNGVGKPYFIPKGDNPKWYDNSLSTYNENGTHRR